VTASPAIVLAGSVSFSERTLAALLRHGADVRGVLALARTAAGAVSDYSDLSVPSRDASIPVFEFTNINAPEVREQIRIWRPDVIFVVGLSQLVGPDLMSIARLGCVGFHPTRLPEGRGRAPVAWLTHDGRNGAATFFALVDDVDAGAIFVQEPFNVAPGDYAQDVIESVRAAIDRALDLWLPRLLRGEWDPTPQEELAATWWGKRGPEDGLIDWNALAIEIERLVRTASRPYPGAYTYCRGRKVIIWRAETTDLPFRGVVGRVLRVRQGEALVQTGTGQLLLTETEFDPAPFALQTGMKLGYAVQDELHAIRNRLQALESLRER
jgi:methionyl-tRNA formyltransferase